MSLFLRLRGYLSALLTEATINESGVFQDLSSDVKGHIPRLVKGRKEEGRLLSVSVFARTLLLNVDCLPLPHCFSSPLLLLSPPFFSLSLSLSLTRTHTHRRQLRKNQTATVTPTSGWVKS